MTTKQEIIICQDTLPKEEVCVSPSSANNAEKITSVNFPSVNVSKKSRCSFGDCKKRTAKIIGDCKYCDQKFCSMHRLPELHLCCKMNDVKNNSRQILENKLNNEKCVGQKINQII